MALINCPECGRTLSDKAKQCPGCGVDMKTIKKIIKNNDSEIIDEAVVVNKPENTVLETTVHEEVVSKEKSNVVVEDSEKLVENESQSISEHSTSVIESNEAIIEKKKNDRNNNSRAMLKIIIGTIVLAILFVVLFLVINWNKFKANGTFESIYNSAGICLSHDYVDANCESPKRCRICGKTTGSALGHDYEQASTVEATCTEKGRDTFICIRCKDTYANELDALGHSYEGDPEVLEPTCTETGSMINECIRCGEMIEEIIPATGHDLTEATCTTPSICVKCNEEVGDSLGHTTMNGICDRCGENIVEPIEFSGHGDTVLSDVHVPIGQYKVYLTHTGSSNFIIHAYSGDGDRASWMNEIGAFTGYIYTKMDMSNGMIEMKADGDWVVKFEQIGENGTSNVQGKGYAVSPYFTLEDGNLIVNIENKASKSNFISKLIDENGNIRSLTNEIGDYTGQTIVNNLSEGVKYCLWVRSDGDWSFDFGLGDEVTYVSNKE